MNIEETVERFIADFEKAKGIRANYFWQEAFESALAETDHSTRKRSIEFAEVLLCGRRQQLQQFANELDALQELDSLKVAIERVRGASWPTEYATSDRNMLEGYPSMVRSDSECWDVEKLREQLFYSGIVALGRTHGTSGGA